MDVIKLTKDLAHILHTSRCGWNCPGHGMLQAIQDAKDLRDAESIIRYLRHNNLLREEDQ